jgi:hypothetical protein
MAHYARIEEGLVTSVLLVANDEDAAGFPGQWVKTSYNSRGGVHYGADGQPDGGQALRKNYACVGDTYDKALDAFYSPQPSPFHRLDPYTCLWVDTRGVQAPEPRVAADYRKSVYTPSRTLSPALQEAFQALQERSGITVSQNFKKASAALLVSTQDLVELLEDPLGRLVAPVNWLTYQTLFEETGLGAYGLNVLSVEESQALTYPLQVLSVSVAVNQRHETLCWDTVKGSRRCQGAECTERSVHETLSPHVEDAIRAACLGMQLPAGLHTLSFVFRSNYWFLLDWQPTLDPACLQAFLQDPDALELALMHVTS